MPNPFDITYRIRRPEWTVKCKRDGGSNVWTADAGLYALCAFADYSPRPSCWYWQVGNDTLVIAHGEEPTEELAKSAAEASWVALLPLIPVKQP